MENTHRIIRRDMLVAQPWKNGAGTTREIARDGEGDTWTWRVSIADVTAEAPFSTFPGVDRELVLLEGEGIELDFGAGQVEQVLPPYGKHRFAGEAPITGRPLSGATRDFNLMWRRDTWEGSLDIRPMVGNVVVFAAPGEIWLLHLAAGSVSLPDSSEMLSQGDTLVVEATERQSMRMDGTGTAFLIRLQSND